MRTALLFIILLSQIPSLAQDSLLLIRNGIVFDGTGSAAQKGLDILIRGSVIIKTGKNLDVTPLTKIIDARGKTILPGLIDMHGHLFGMGRTQREAFPALYLANGVTTIFSPGEFEPDSVLRLQAEVIKGTTPGPDIFFTGPYFNSRSSMGSWMADASDSVLVEQLFNKWKDKIKGIKVYAGITKLDFAHLVRLAKENELFVTGHLGTLETKYAVQHGIRGLEHALLSISDFGGDPKNYGRQLCHIANLDLSRKDVNALIELIVRNKVYVDPTLVVLESMLTDFRPLTTDFADYFSKGTAEANNSFMTAFRKAIDESCLPAAMEADLRYTKMIYDEGGLLVAGSDPGGGWVLPGFGLKREIQLLVQCGISLEQAIRISSLNGATVLGIEKITGSIERGKNADLSIVDGDITKNILDIEKSELVIKRGKIYRPATLLQSARGKIVAR